MKYLVISNTGIGRMIMEGTTAGGQSALQSLPIDDPPSSFIHFRHNIQVFRINSEYVLSDNAKMEEKNV
jgi:hypothetical protein